MLLSWLGYKPKKKIHLIAPTIETTEEISIVIPVKDNQQGINHFLDACCKLQELESSPLEIIVVCDKGTSITLPQNHLQYPIQVSILHSNGIGPASARNLGWQNARGKWILFTDSDCIPTSAWLNGYIEASNGSIGYAGTVLSYSQDFISRYCESQKILQPTTNNQLGIHSPDYLITANALVWKEALEKIGGFNETIKIAAGEDIDLGFRLWENGNLSFAENSKVFHDFNGGFIGFIKRFKRYGRGNRLLADMYKLKVRPTRFKPKEKSLINSMLASVQYFSMLWGYYFS